METIYEYIIQDKESIWQEKWGKEENWAVEQKTYIQILAINLGSCKILS